MRKLNFYHQEILKMDTLIESGFITTDKNIEIPNSNSVWSVSGNSKLTRSVSC